MKLVLERDPPPIKRPINPEIQNLIFSMLEKDPANRPSISEVK